MSSSYHPQTKGQIEVVNRTLEQYLRCFTCDQPQKWVDWIPWAEYSYNTTTHTSIGVSPFEIMYGITPPTLLSNIPSITRVQVVDEFLRTKEEILCELCHNLIASLDHMKS